MYIVELDAIIDFEIRHAVLLRNNQRLAVNQSDHFMADGERINDVRQIAKHLLNVDDAEDECLIGHYDVSHGHRLARPWIINLILEEHEPDRPCKALEAYNDSELASLRNTLLNAG